MSAHSNGPCVHSGSHTTTFTSLRKFIFCFAEHREALHSKMSSVYVDFFWLDDDEKFD